jgi:GT2 family glycosyltransferase/glycosyltransferase involved in cell wall biosynthesis
MLSAKPLQICIVTGDIAGPIRNGGIGTFYRALAFELAAAGHRVTVLYTLGDFCETLSIDHWRKWYAEKNIEFVPLPPLCSFTRPHTPARISLDVYHWLRERSFDLVHCPEWRGNAFYSLLARRQGLAFPSTLFVIGTHSPTAWHRDGMGIFLTDIDDLQTDHLERTSVALADRVISPSRYMLRWMEDHGWKLPESTECIQCIQPTYHPPAGDADPIVGPINELVFFGRLETRKGLILFCDAIDRLDSQLDARITFLGKLTTVDGKPSRGYIQSRAARWTFPITILDTLDHAAALHYLGQPGRLAVVSSLLENSPNTVLECLSNTIPCLASNVGGIPELVDPRDRDRTLFTPRPATLAERLTGSLKHGHAPSRPAVHPHTTRDIWLNWHEKTARDLQALSEPAHATAPHLATTPFISVILTTYNRPELLRHALESLYAQTFDSFEVILVDDGSTDPTAIVFLDSLQSEFTRRGWTILRQHNQYLGAARNNGINRSRGKWILCMDDDNVAKPHELATFAAVARRGTADILSCLVDLFSGDSPPAGDADLLYRWLPIGGATAAGAFVNIFGDTNSLVRREVFRALGGYSEDYGLGNEDWELYAKAALAGYTHQVVPEALFWYRVIDNSMSRTTPRYANILRSLRPYLDHVGPQLAGTIELAVGLYVTSQIPPPPPTPSPSPANAAVPLPMNGDPDAYQRLVDDYWDSASWRISAPLRNAAMRLRGRRPAPRPIVSSRYCADIIINDIRSSISWEITGPLRALGRMFNALRRP